MGKVEDPDLLSDEEFERQLWLYILGSFPDGWEKAKKKILADRKARTIKLLEEPSDEQMHAKAVYEDDREQELLGLLEELYNACPDETFEQSGGDSLEVRIRQALKFP